jgi:hypothetical protein
LQIFKKLELSSLVLLTAKDNNVDYSSIQQINMHFQFMILQETILIIVYLQKEHQRRFGVCVLMYWRMEFLYLKIRFGIKSSKKPTKDLEKTDREFLGLQNYIYQ